MHKCRLCLKGRGTKALDMVFQIKKKTISYTDVIMFSLSLQALADSEIYSKVCKACSKKIVSFYRFKSQALKNEAWLNKMGYLKSHFLNECEDHVTVKLENHSDLENEQLDADGYQEEVFVASVKPEPEAEEPTVEYESEVVPESNTDSEESDGYVKVEVKPMEKRKKVINKDQAVIRQEMSKLPAKRRRKNIKEAKPVKLEVKPKEEDLSSSDCLKSDESDEEFNIKQCLLKEKDAPASTWSKKKHTKEDIRPVKICEKCGDLYTRMARHRIQCQKNCGVIISKDYRCGGCGFEVTIRSDERKHYTIIDGIRQYICDTCFAKKLQNPKPNRHVCPLCGVALASPAALTAHAVTHSEEKPFACSDCDKRFKLKIGLSAHICRVHLKLKRYSCSFCSKKFFTNSALKRHIKIHTGEKDYQCVLCPKAYNTDSSLRHHLLVHAGVKQFACETCGKRFLSKHQLNVHAFTHKKLKPFPCSHCSLNFTRADNRKTHERNVHLRKVEAKSDSV